MLKAPYFNPGNLEKSYDYEGKSLFFVGEVYRPDVSMFRCFVDVRYGYRALIKQILEYYSKGLKTLAEIIPVFAPVLDNNDTPTYIKAVCSEINMSPGQQIVITKNFLISFASAISRQENGIETILSDVESGFDLLSEK
jgi:hypothetical protein